MNEVLVETKVIESTDAPRAVDPYSQAIQVGNLMFTSGQLPIDPASGKIPEGPISIRAYQAIKNLSAIVSEAVKLLAQTESIFLDPVYSGNAMAGLIDLDRNDHFEPGTNVLFLHTGGSPALYAYLNTFQL